MRYGVGIGRDGFAWGGEGVIQWRQKWPKWTPPDEMIARQPELAKYSADNGGMPPGLTNPLGARALYIFQNGQDTLYRLHGTSEVWSIGKARGVTTDVLVLSGIAMLFLFQSAQSLIQYMATPEVLQEIVFWLFGSLLKANWTSTFVTGAVLLAVIPILARDAWKLTALTMGDQTAASLGLKVGPIRLRMLILISILTASAVAFVGTIGFVGLVAPHIARGFVGEDQRFLMPLSAMAGAFILVGSSVFAKLISPGTVIPIGIVTAVIGVPFLFLLILRKKRM